ncbi:MAG: CehA/McbA family metallohydrolase, partial [Acidobacteriota bacterium]
MMMTASLSGHPRHTNPILGELNDYLAALQLLKSEDERAGQLFQEWVRLREASWEIRNLTEAQGHLISDPVVVAQIQKTTQLRKELRDRCLDYFDALRSSAPAASVRVGEAVRVEWGERPIEVLVGQRKVIPIALENETGETVDLDMAGRRGSEVLFWKQSLELEPGIRRYVFAYLAPSSEGPMNNPIRFSRANRQQATLLIEAVGRQQEPVDAVKVPEQRIELSARDAVSGDLLPVRVEVTDSTGKSYWEPLFGTSFPVTTDSYGHWETPLWPFQPGPFFYIDGSGILGVEPKDKVVRYFHGFEHLPAEVKVGEDGRAEATLKRWINMAERGWYSGQTHIHTTEQGLPVPWFDSWPLISRSEGLQVSHILTLKGEWTTHAVYANEYPMGVVPSASDHKHFIGYGEEYRNNPYGHLGLLGLEELIQPISSGALGELGGPDYPPNSFILDQALAQGAATFGAHFGLSVLKNDPIKTPWPSTGFEMPVDVALGKLQIAEIYGNGGQLDVWYKLLNCGFDLPGTAGPDWVMKDTPRTYVYLGDEPLSLDAWTEGLRLGKSFMTHGPMLFLTVDGQRPGAHLHRSEAPAEVLVEAQALMPSGSIPLEVVVNGEVVAQGTDLKESIVLSDSAWIAVRCEHAHSNPVYVEIAGRPRGFASEAEEFIQVTERFQKWVEEKGLFENDGQRQTVLQVIEEGREVYRGIAERARRLGRTR